MKIPLNSIVAAAVCIAFVCFDPALAREAAQGGGRGGPANVPPAGPVPRLSNGKPDLSGLWANPYTPNMAGNRGGSVLDPKTGQPLEWARRGEALPDAKGTPGKTLDLPYTELGLAEWKAYDVEKNGDYAGSCLPFGMSRNINSPHGVQIIHHADALAFLFEQNTWFHWVPTDPNFKWPGDLPANWTGISTGRWEGDKLIVETTNFNGYTKLDTNGHPHSRELKITNTFLRTDSRTMTHTVTIHDPKTYTQDWMNVRTWRIKPYPDVIMEYSCEENNLGLEDGTITRWRYPENVD